MEPWQMGLGVGLGIPLGWCAVYCLEVLSDWLRRRR